MPAAENGKLLYSKKLLPLQENSEVICLCVSSNSNLAVSCGRMLHPLPLQLDHHKGASTQAAAWMGWLREGSYKARVRLSHSSPRLLRLLGQSLTQEPTSVTRRVYWTQPGWAASQPCSKLAGPFPIRHFWKTLDRVVQMTAVYPGHVEEG